MKCNQECKKTNELYSNIEVELAESQHPTYKIVTAEKIKHKGNKKNIESRAIIFAPVGNTSLFWNDENEQQRVPKIILVGFSTSNEAMQQFYKLSVENDFNTSCKRSSFGGSPTLRENILRMFNFLELGTRFELDEIFEPEQTDIMHTQIIKCCSLGKVNSIYKDSSAIYPNKVDKSIEDLYLNHSGHRNCIDKIFVKEINFKSVIPLVLIFKPAWENLRGMGLLANINAKILEWLPHPSNPGNDVIKLLNMYEEGEDITQYDWKESSKQLIKIKRKLNETKGLFD